MKPKKDTPESAAAEGEPIHPLDVMRLAYQAMEITFQEDEDSIFTRLNLKNVEVEVISFGAPDDFAATGRSGWPRSWRRWRDREQAGDSVAFSIIWPGTPTRFSPTSPAFFRGG